MQTFEESLGDGLEEFVEGSQAKEHPLAVGCNHIFSVGYHPVEAAAASYYVLKGWPVDDDYRIFARTPREDVFGLVATNIAIGHEVVTSPTHYVVGAEATGNYIVATTAHQVFLTPKGACSAAAENYIFAPSAHQVVSAAQGKEDRKSVV